MKTYTVIAGVNGVGKSSFTGVLKSTRNDLGFIIDPDKIAAENKSHASAGKTAVRKIREAIANGITFTQETTLSGSFIKRVIKTAAADGYVVRLFYIGLSSCEESLKRIKNRVEKGGHNVPEEDVRRRFNKRLADLKAVLPYCNEAYFYDNENGFNEVGEYKNGEVIPKGITFYQWFDDVIKLLTD